MGTRENRPPAIYVVRNEVDPDKTFHCDALAARFPDAREVDFAAGERFDPGDADGVVLTGSTAGVYEADRHPWIDDQKTLVRDLADRGIPTLGVCFGHQIANSALGGTVEDVGTTAGLVEADLTDAAVFEGVSPVVPALHGDIVTEPGEGMTVLASAGHAPVFATRHETAPMWTVQFHPEITASLRDRLVEDYEWASDPHSFEEVSAERIFENFKAFVGEISHPSH